MFGVCNLSIVPCRKDASDRSELVTQLLFGECFEILNTKGNWVNIKTAFDEYECWIDKKQFVSISETTFKKYLKEQISLTEDLVHPAIEHDTKHVFPVVIGSTLHNFKGKNFELAGKEFQFDGNAIKPTKKKRADILEAAFLFLNAPYLWGGRTPFGIDCSGFSQLVYRLNGINILRDANQQAKQGEALSFVDEAKPGDLAFFDNEKGKIVHVGIVLPELNIIHASGKVRVDKLDHHGIYNEELKKYTHSLRVIRNLFDR